MAVTNPKKAQQTSYRGNTYNFLYEFVDQGGSDIDLATDYTDITYRVFAPNQKSSPYVSLSVGGGGLSITNTNELSGELSASETNGLPNVAFYELEFELSDGSTEVYLFGRHIAEDYDSSSGEVSIEATVQINQSTNQVVFAESYDAAAKATQAKVDAETAESNAEGYAANLNRASISSGDAGKIERIKSDESGWENYGDIIVGENNNTINYVGTNEIIWTHDPSDLDGDARTFNLNVHVNDSFPNQTRADTVWQLGYNLDGINGQLDNTDHAFGLQFESFYNANKSVAQWELFTISYDVNGDQFRPISCHGPVDATANDVNYSVSFTSEEVIFYQPDRVNVEIDQRIGINFSTNNIYFYEDDAGDGLKLINRSNDARFLVQYDTGGSEITLLYLNSNDRVSVGQGGYEVVFPSNKVRGSADLTFYGGGKVNIGDSTENMDLHITGNTTNLLRLNYGGDADANEWAVAVFEDQFYIQYSGSGNNPFLSEDAPSDTLRLLQSGAVKMANLPTSDPVEAGVLWNDAGTVKVSAG